jgi:P27 family predicted phage terminase small subunit
MKQVGRKPVPTNLKVLRGNPGNRPLNKNEPKPERSIPRPPKFLNKLAKKEFRRVARLLFPLGLMTELDMPALAAYAESFARWAEAVEKIEGEGMMAVGSKNGHLYQNGYVGIANSAMKQMMSIATEFGMTPSSRARVSVPTNKPLKGGGNAYDAWKNGE